MRKTHKIFEIVPVEVAKKILEREKSSARGAVNLKPVNKKSARAPAGIRILPKKVGV
jgi:hypothetical protein